MKLVIFDLDGTLTQTNEVDDLCFPRVFAENLGVADLNTDWSSYTHSTDTVVFQEAFAERLGRSPTAQEAQAFEQRFIESLAELHASRPEMFAEVRGATALLRQLEQDSRWAVAIATGCWKRSAEFKIHAAGLPAFGIASAFAEDGPSRHAIVESAIRRTMAYHDQTFANIVLVGDRIWDVKTAQTLRLPFVGVATTEPAELLRRAGAGFVVENYLNAPGFLQCLEEATVPLVASTRFQS
jgi:phosphoglycolate phosphatase-like HAD superfamily hydrolase